MNFYIDIGYTNTKILDENNKIQIFQNNLEWLDEFLNRNKDHKFYIINNNVDYVEYLKNSSLKLADKLRIIDNNDFLEAFNLDNRFKKEEIGLDLLAIIYYFKEMKFQEGLILSSGSGLVGLVFKNYELVSVSINLGLVYCSEAINNYLKLEKHPNFSKNYGVDTKSALELGNYLYLKGLILSSFNEFEIENRICILTGNTFNKVNKRILEDKNYELSLNEHLVLKGLKLFCEKRK